MQWVLEVTATGKAEAKKGFVQTSFVEVYFFKGLSLTNEIANSLPYISIKTSLGTITVTLGLYIEDAMQKFMLTVQRLKNKIGEAPNIKCCN